ncbi:Histone deacetylase 8 [Coemansia biformis]|uniref:Histone deacetylase n=1 Tax=Coemansia biformis TaxID=1286918 RepID=A0A9W8CXE8_9FUNG|nr:Histone deacetylase 8 [Coemansia biformis]
MATARRVALVRSAQSICAADRLPSNPGRASRVHALVDAFGLSKGIAVIEPELMTDAALAAFHSEEYIACLFGQGADMSDCSDSDGGSPESTNDARSRHEMFGLVDDCAPFEGLEEYVRFAAGGTVVAARALADDKAQVAIHWEGGRHHCQRSEAAGFCYVNDVVLGILELQTRFERVLYVDLDLHHGDGVQDAFAYSRRVMTVSVHLHERGFYPNSGGSYDEGRGRGAGHSINVPLRRGVRDDTFVRVCVAVGDCAVQAFAPTAVVVQCGCDGLAGDPHRAFGLTADAYCAVVEHVLGWGRPVLLLGGGGYNRADCARCWARLTAVACGRSISDAADVPEHRFLADYAPGFDMATAPAAIGDENTDELIGTTIRAIQRIIHSSPRAEPR